jgi:hypothetical protein
MILPKLLSIGPKKILWHKRVILDVRAESAWVLMPNHFHLLCKTKNLPLASSMRRILTGYVVTFNKRHRGYGHLFAFAVRPCSFVVAERRSRPAGLQG